MNDNGQSSRADLFERVAELVAIPSLTGDESDAIDWVHGWLEGASPDEIERWNDPVAILEMDADYPGREVERTIVPVVAARIRGSEPGPIVTLTGHVDTVPPGDPRRWTADPWEPRREGDRLYGLGACDMKGGIVAAVAAFATLAARSRDFGGELQLVAVPGEEDGGIGTLSAIRHGWGGDLVIVTEPTSRGGTPQIVVAHGGALTFTIEVVGRSAHASIAPEGENALDHFWVINQALRRIEREVNERESNPVMVALGTPYATNVGRVAGGVWSASVMEHLSAEVRMGVALGETIAEAEQRVIDGVMAAAAEDPWLHVHPPMVARSGGAFGSAHTPISHHLVTTLTAAAAGSDGQRPETIGVPYGCDMALWQRVGGSTPVVFGPGDIRQAHAPDEWVSMAQVGEVAEVLVATCSALLGFRGSG